MTHSHFKLCNCYTRCFWRQVKAVKRCSATQLPIPSLVYQSEQQQALPFCYSELPCFLRRGRYRRRTGQGPWLAAACHPLVSWEAIPLTDLTHGWTPNNSSQSMWPTLVIEMGSRWHNDPSQLCHSCPRVSIHHPRLEFTLSR